MNKTTLFALALMSVVIRCTPADESTPTADFVQASPINASPADLQRWEQHAANVTILRDHWGIPHIYGRSDADTVFGTLFAQAEDDFNRVETNYINAMGLLAEAEGESAIYQDLRMQLFIQPEDLQEQYQSSPAWLQSLMNAFADGLNYYLYNHPEVEPRVIQKFEPWMALSFTEGSIGGDIERVDLNSLQSFYGDEQGRSDSNLLANNSAPKDEEPRGSNGFAISPANTANGNALFLINPHTSFFFRSELHMVSEEGLNAYGAVTWGQFFVYQGFNENTGWMHTSSRADAIDEYLETIIEKNDGYYYAYGDDERKLEESSRVLQYKEGESIASKEFTVYHSHHGPVIREQDGKWVSIKLMQSPVDALIQSYTRTKTTNYVEFHDTMKLQTNSSNNTVYADSDGNIAYFHGNFIPVRDTQFDWNLPLDGSNPATEWRGLHTVEETINLLNPPNGWIQNTNNTPFSAAGEFSPKQENYPIYMANNPENFRGIHAVKVLAHKSDFTLDTLIEAAYEPTLTAFEQLVPELILITATDDNQEQQFSIQPETLLYIDLLRNWDLKASVDSEATSLAIYWAEEMRSSLSDDAAAAGISIYDYMIEQSNTSQKLRALRIAAEKLTADFGSWQVPWGEINRYQRNNGNIVQQFDDSKPSIAVGFASSRWGSLASFGARTYPGTKRMYGTSGNSFVAAVEFGDRVRAKAITVGGLNSDPDSEHFADQAQMYAQGNFRDVLFYREDVEENLERTYQPGLQ
ncbi:MAG: penicillin acylase family protein [Gammaproteobacteria bacterium]|jgi:acyl-homoserine-lactone acylase|nr:penicillin acylase family protein [Gammaproteobacteria bacterium]